MISGLKLANGITNKVVLQLTLFALFVFITIGHSAAQQLIFSQNYSVPTIISPSFTGLIEKDRMALSYRDQWPAIPNTYVTYAMNYDHNFAKLKSGMGIQFLKDRAGAGDMSLTNVSFLYSYNIKVNKDWYVRPGLSFILSERNFNFAALTFGDELVTGTGQGTIEVKPYEKRQYIDFSSSVLGYSKQYWAGLTVDNMMRPNQSFKGDTARVPMKFTLIGGVKIPVDFGGKRLKDIQSVSFTMIYRNQQFYDQLDIGAYYTQEPFQAGIWFRGFPITSNMNVSDVNFMDAIILLVGYKIMDISIGYSYDFTVSNLINHSGGAHELSVVYQFRKDFKRKGKTKYAAVPCPGF